MPRMGRGREGRAGPGPPANERVAWAGAGQRTGRRGRRRAGRRREATPATGAGRPHPLGCRPRGGKPDDTLSSSFEPPNTKRERTRPHHFVSEAHSPPRDPWGGMARAQGQDARGDSRTAVPVCRGPGDCRDGPVLRDRLARQLSGAADGWSFTKQRCSDSSQPGELPPGNVRPRQRVFAGGTPSLL